MAASSATECCQQGGRSFNDGSDCITACGLIGKLFSATIRLSSNKREVYS